MPAMFEFPLDLPEVRIIKSETSERDITITVESTRESAICWKCGRETHEFHGYGRTLRLRHLPILGRPVFIELRPKRFRCPFCDDHPTTTQKLDWYDERSPHTKAYDEWLLLSVISSTISDVARKEYASYDEVLGALERKVASTVNWAEIEHLEILGMDEIALKKGHRDFITLVTTRQTNGELKLLAVLKDRRLETVKEFLLSIPEKLRATIREVCSDMYDGYTSAVKEVLPQAKLVVDRFHVATAYRDCADQLRKQVQRELKAELSDEEYEALKGTMWLFRRDPQELSKEEREKLALLFECAPDLKRAYELREQLTAIFDSAHTKASAIAAIKRWIKRVRESGLRCFDRFLVTLENWFDEITNYFVSRLTSGFVEGYNNKVKVLKRRCYGITNIKHLFQRLYLDLEGYRLFGR
jgi:transposase